MRRFSTLLATLATLTSVAACSHTQTHISVDNAVLGRVVIYRNGVAFYERTAKVVDGKVVVGVPRDRVDDFLKSLTVIDKATNKPLAVSIPRQESDNGNYLVMTIETNDLKDGEALLTYVTESPSWKPSYRVVLGDNGKVMLESWAIVDNVSGEDWKHVLVGVGASSALSFRYDLWSVRHVDRDLLQGESQFAVAPPTGVSPYANGDGEELATLDEGTYQGATGGVAFTGTESLQNQYYVDGVNTTGLTFGTVGDGGSSSSSSPAPTNNAAIAGAVTDSSSGERLAGVTVIATKNGGAKDTITAITDDKGGYNIANIEPGNYNVTYYYGDVTVERNNVAVGANKTTPIYQKLKSTGAGGETIKIASAPPIIDQGSEQTGITLQRDFTKNIASPGRTFDSALGSAAGAQSDGNGRSSGSQPAKSAPDPLAGISAKVLKTKKDVLIETYGMNISEVKQRAEAIKNKLVDQGVPATKIHIVPKTGSQDHRVRVLAIDPAKVAAATGEPSKNLNVGAPPSATRGATLDTPVGESHFEAERPMNVKAGSSAMVAMVHGETTGGVVYLYDPISERGDDRFAFKAVRLDNPTDDTLEPGPITVYGQGRFIGEGITEPVPPKASVVIPFAADRQVVVSLHDDSEDRIAKLVTAQRGILTAEMQHRKETKFTVTSRLGKPAKVYLRHRLESGWKLVDAPPRHMTVGDSTLFEVDLGPNETKYVTIAEATPIERTLDLGSPDTLDKMKVFIDDPAATPAVRAQVTALLATHKEAADLIDQIQTLHDQLTEYRQRAGELHGQLVTLKLVKTSGELMTALKAKLVDTSERMQKATIAVVDAQEKLMLTRVKFQNQLADLHLTDVTATR